MASQAENREQDLNLDFKEIKQRFFALNRARLIRIRAVLRQRQLVFLELLPLLYHINRPTLPGYVSKHTPAGIPDYSPASVTQQLAARLSKSFSYERSVERRFHIQALYMIGSTGTITYSNQGFELGHGIISRLMKFRRYNFYLDKGRNNSWQVVSSRNNK